MSDTDRLIKFMREEAAIATDERESWFTATAAALESQSSEGELLREAGERVITHSQPDRSTSSNMRWVPKWVLLKLAEALAPVSERLNDEQADKVRWEYEQGLDGPEHERD